MEITFENDLRIEDIDEPMELAYSPIQKDPIVEDPDLDIPPPAPLYRQIAGEAENMRNIEMIELFGLAQFIEDKKGLYSPECQTPLYIYLNNPEYIRAQQKYLEKKFKPR